MVILFVAGIIALCAVLVLFSPDLINVLSEADCKKMNPIWLVSVVPYSISTSNHNFSPILQFIVLLFLILFLHQTTTIDIVFRRRTGLFLILFLHQTTTCHNLEKLSIGCSLFYFYIKPQLICFGVNSPIRCSLFYFYIKPQPIDAEVSRANVVPYSISTSNHNNNNNEGQWMYVVPYSISTSNHNNTLHYANLV